MQAEGKINLRELTEGALLAHYAQAGVLVNGRGEILYIYDRTGKFIAAHAASQAALQRSEASLIAAQHMAHLVS